MEARRYRLAVAAFLRNSGTPRDVQRATNCSRAELDELLGGSCAFLTGGKARRVERLLPPREREWVRESRRWPIAVGMVPTELVAPLLEEAFARHGRVATARLTGIEARQLFGVVMERSGIRFEIADRIVTRLAGPDWWLETAERRRFYWGADKVFGRSLEPCWRSNRKALARRRAKVAASAGQRGATRSYNVPEAT